MAYKIFISHSGADRQWVEQIDVIAKNSGIDTYLYEHDPQPGKSVAEKVKQAIQNSDALVVLLTYNSQFSPYVQQEIGFAEARGMRIIPLVQPSIPERSLAMLEGREYIPFDFYNPQGAVLKLFNCLQQQLRLKKAKENEQTILMLIIVGLFFLALMFGGKK